MPYKIVQTVEDGDITLTVVPAQWENKGLLWWPKNIKNPSKLIKDVNSRPGEGWMNLKCTLKRNYIPTYEEAHKELSTMSQNTDTDQMENESYDVCFPAGTSKTNRDIINFEGMAENLEHPQPAMDVSLGSIQPAQQETVQLLQQETVQIISTEKSDILLNNQDLILNKLHSIIENQKRIGKKLAVVTVQLSETSKEIKHLQEKQECNVTLLQDASVEEKESFSFKPIENNEEFEIFELNLTDKMYRKKLIKLLSVLYSSKGAEGITCAYKLIDVLFSKDFLCQCSWSGASKGENSKVPMKNFKNFRKFFFEIIRLWDPTFTDDQMVKFFKVILRNAQKRKSMKGLRDSTKRIRKYKETTYQKDNEVILLEDYNVESNQLEANNSNNIENVNV